MKIQLLKPSKNIELKVTEDSQYVLIPNGEISCDIFLEKKNVSVELLVPFVLSKKQKVKLKTTSNHLAPNTKCNVNVRGVLKDASMFDFEGKIIIGKKAQQTVSYLEDDILNIGSKTRNNSQPILEIEADDVKASHGATTGRIAEEDLYYLMSRGLNKEEAEYLIITGFLDSVIDLIEDSTVRQKITKELHD